MTCLRLGAASVHRRLIEGAAPNGPRRLPAMLGVVHIHSDLEGLTDAQARRALAGLPPARDYEVVIKPLRYRSSPHLAERCEFDARRIVLQVPIPFRPFK